MKKIITETQLRNLIKETITKELNKAIKEGRIGDFIRRNINSAERNEKAYYYENIAHEYYRRYNEVYDYFTPLERMFITDSISFVQRYGTLLRAGKKIDQDKVNRHIKRIEDILAKKEEEKRRG